TSSFDLTLNLTVRSPFPNFSISEESATSGLEIDVDTKKIMTATITTATRAMIIIIIKRRFVDSKTLFIGTTIPNDQYCPVLPISIGVNI
ncbi:MAG TPA: hypothetical protein PK148_05480, partial [Petrotogaceae bacterium]|nr:hypothetical protein [Petrotogaceae bacterium]